MAHSTYRGTALVRLRRVRVWPVVLAALVILLASATAAQVALRLIGEGRAAEPRPRLSVAVPAEATRAPASAIYAAPASGSTGTIALPPVPAAFDRTPIDSGGVVAARPFSIAAARSPDRGRALDCLTAAIYYEAASEPDDGQRAVAQVVLNRVRHPAFPATVCGVVYQGAERGACQFSFACDGATARVPSVAGWSRAARHAAAALGGYVFAPVGLATHYHTYAVTPAWNRTLVMTDAIGAHFFHRWKGFWGTAGAFVQRYAGHEPATEPLQRAALQLVQPAAVTNQQPVTPADVTLTASSPVEEVTAAAKARLLTPDADIQPRHVTSGDPVVPATGIARQLPESLILDRWKDSGKPLR